MKILDFSGMIHAGIGATHVNNFLNGLNVPPVNSSTIKKKENETGKIVFTVAQEACKLNQKKEQLMSYWKVEASFDAEWQKRGTGWNYESNTDQYVDFDMETRCLSRNSDITQWAAVSGQNLFQRYIMPRCDISNEASKITGIEDNKDKNIEIAETESLGDMEKPTAEDTLTEDKSEMTIQQL
ncbi:unnamed protein product [Mytilus coruscus]|uniref:Mutator-like transposase domain-containing protein n=1 Tax=Mytilus coruscus TaxID=42192 RepID=A0A6J7ZW63_MYTCO|nr:unnamed protein product [Mytilus coruscus]